MYPGLASNFGLLNLPTPSSKHWDYRQARTPLFVYTVVGTHPTSGLQHQGWVSTVSMEESLQPTKELH